MSKIAIIAGRGRLPSVLAAGLDAPLICALDGYPPEGLTVDLTFRVERLMPFLRALGDAGVEKVCFAGAVQRPRLDPSLFDPLTAQMVPRLLAAMQGGDDATLRAVIGLFEENDFAVVAAHDLLPDLLPEPGVLVGAPSDADRRDADRAAAIVTALGAVDIGQGAVVAQGLCLAVETLPGTDAMLDFVTATGRRPNPNGAKGVFFKAPKPGQDHRIDLPVLGLDTLARVQAAGLAGIAFQAGGVILLDRAAMVAEAERLGLFLWARE